MRIFHVLQDKQEFLLREIVSGEYEMSRELERGNYTDCMKEFDRLSMTGDELVIFSHRLILIKK